MAKFSQGFMDVLSRTGTPQAAMQQGQQEAPAYGSLQRNLGAAFNMDQRSRPEMASAAIDRIDPNSKDALIQSLAVQAKYEQDPQKKIVYMLEIDKIKKAAAEEQIGKEEKTAKQSETDKIRKFYADELKADYPMLSGAVARGAYDGKFTELDKIVQSPLKENELISKYKQAKTEGYKGSFVDFMSFEANLKDPGGSDGRTAEEKQYDLYVTQTTAAGGTAMPFIKFMDRNANVANVSETQRSFQADLDSGTLPPAINNLAMYKLYTTGKINGEAQPVTEKGSAAYKTAADSQGNLRWLDGPNAGKYVFQDSVDQSKKNAADLQAADTQKRELAAQSLEVQFPQLAAQLRSGVMSIDQALSRSKLDPSIITATNNLVEESVTSKRNTSSAVDLLVQYNKNVPLSGVAGSIAEASKRFFGKENESSLQRMTFKGLANLAAAEYFPQGSITEFEVKRADQAVPDVNASPEVIRDWLHAVAKKTALVAEEKNMRAKWLSQNQGNLSGYTEARDAFFTNRKNVENLYAKYGVPPTSNFVPKETSYATATGK